MLTQHRHAFRAAALAPLSSLVFPMLGLFFIDLPWARGDALASGVVGRTCVLLYQLAATCPDVCRWSADEIGLFVFATAVCLFFAYVGILLFGLPVYWLMRHTLKSGEPGCWFALAVVVPPVAGIVCGVLTYRLTTNGEHGDEPVGMSLGIAAFLLALPVAGVFSWLTRRFARWAEAGRLSGRE